MPPNLNLDGVTRRSVLRSVGAAAAGSTALTGAGTASAATREEVEVEMSDGVTIRGQLFFPTDENGDRAEGPFSVVATFEPYRTENDETGPARPRGTEELVANGYVRAEFEVRGTAGSGGRFRGGDVREQKDYGELIYWLAGRDWSNGKVGLYGISYKGLTQFLAARGLQRVEAPEGVPDSPLEALFPVVTGVDAYRNVLFNGGLYDAVFGSFWIPYVAGTPVVTPLLTEEMSPREVSEATQSHLAGAYSYGLGNAAGAQVGTERAYREDYWRERTWEDKFPAVVEQDIPVFTVQGWHDIFQPGSVHVYTQFQNLWAGRDQYAPMDPDQEVTDRYQCVVGSYYHVTAKGDLQWAVKWFDRFLKDDRNGTDETETETPLHLFQLFGDRWADAKTWPLPEFGDRRIETYYLDAGRTGTAPHSLNDGALRRSNPSVSEASDTLPWRHHNPCNQGAREEGTFGLVGQNPCSDSGRGFEAGTLTYTTPAFEGGRNLAGPIALRLFAAADTTNTSWAVALNDVAPDGTSTLLSKGQLLGSFRETNDERTWHVADDDRRGSGPEDRREARPDDAPPGHARTATGARADGGDEKLLRPLHDYTQESEKPVEPGAVEQYDVLLDPVFARVREGHRLRLAIRTNSSWAQPLAKDLDDVVGTYQVQRNADHASFVNLPFVEGPVPESSTTWGPCYKDCGSSSEEG